MNDTPPLSPPRLLAKSYLLLFALLPWSIDVDLGQWNLHLPSEPLIMIVGLMLAWHVGTRPIQLSISQTTALERITFLWILWLAVSACFSSMKTVSLKYWLVEAGHWWVFAVGMALWPGLWRRALSWFTLSMLGVALYTVAHHAMFSFRADQALLAPMPFFPDHTMYAAILVMLLFYIPAQESAMINRNPKIKAAVTAFFAGALFLSTCRAALLSLVVCGLVYAGYFFRKRLYYLLIGAVITGAVCYPMAHERVQRSLANDVSFQERLNRWDCANTMLWERPWTGFGPGTYQFQYLSFQKAEKMTRISLQTPLLKRSPDTYGRGGRAHSEYWQAASESGIPGILIWLALVITTLWTGFRLAIQAQDKPQQQLALMLTLGLLSYFVHAMLNNFLHDGRVAMLVWGGVAWLSASERENEPVTG